MTQFALFQPLHDPLFYLLAIPAVVLVGLSKTGLGNGVGAFLVPLLSLALPPQQAAAIMLPILCLMDVIGLRAFWKKWDWQTVRLIIPAGMCGIVLGALLMGLLPTEWLRLLIGLLAIVFGINQWVGYTRNLPPRATSTPRALFWSATSGMTSTLAHAGGPPLMMYLLPLRMPRHTFVATSVVFFFALNLGKLVPYALMGQMNAVNLSTSLMLAPFAPLGILLGIYLLKRMSDRFFYYFTIVMLVCTGGKLTYDSVLKLFFA